MDKRWISVDDRTPEKGKFDWVLVKAKFIPEGWYGVPHVAELRNGKWYAMDVEGRPFEETCSVKVTHWMPLPDDPDAPDQPTPPAESLHEMAKRFCEGRCGGKCGDCPVYQVENGSADDCECIVLSMEEHEGVDHEIDIMRQWAAENPPKGKTCAACEAAHNGCANDGIACGNCKHNPNAVDHYVRAPFAPKPKPKTYREDFDEKFPDAQRDNAGMPTLSVCMYYKLANYRIEEYALTEKRDGWDKPLGYWEEP